MIEVGFVEALNDCINRLNAGSSLADCLRRYPQYAGELRPLLEAGQVVQQNQPGAIEANHAAERQRFRFEQAISEPIRPFPLMQLARLAASLVLIFAFLAGGAGLAAESSIPGDALYTVKLFTESLRLQFGGNDLDLQAQFEDRRLDEARQLINLRRSATMTLSGTVEAVLVEGLLIDGLFIQTDTTGVFAGSRVEVRIESTAQGELVGHEIRQLDEPPAAQQSTDLPPATPIPTETARPTLTREPAAEPTRTHQPTATPVNRITATPMPPEGDRTFNCEEPPDGWIGYTVQAGDTLSELTVNSGGEIDTVIAANCLTDAGHIVVGTTLFLPRRPIRPESTGTEAPTEAVRPPTEVPTRPLQRDQQQQRDQRRPTQERDSGGNDEGGRGR